MTRALAINGSYCDNGFTDQLVALMAAAVSAGGGEFEEFRLRDYPIEFCLNRFRKSSHDYRLPRPLL